MANIELVIKIPEDEYNIAKYGQYGNINVDIVRKAIANGTPLPKGHDRLIEAKRLKEVFRRNTGYDYHDLIDNAPTIIEADKESKE